MEPWEQKIHDQVGEKVARELRLEKISSDFSDYSLDERLNYVTNLTRDLGDVEPWEKGVFENQTGLEESIQKKIFPHVVSITTRDGRLGTGFFCHEETKLVTNAHVIPCKESLAGSTIRGVHGDKIQKELVEMKVKEAYHRPDNCITCPDLSVLALENSHEGCLHIMQMEYDGGQFRHPGKYYLYVYFDYETEELAIKYLQSQSKKNGGLIYHCEDGAPKPGCSGAPLIEASIPNLQPDFSSNNFEKAKSWNFRVVGAVYARDQNDNVYACPIREDIKQVYSIQSELENAEVFRNFDEPNRAAESDKEAKDLWKKYENGETTLDIVLPDGLEKLYGNDPLKFRNSFLNDKTAINALIKNRPSLQEKLEVKDVETLRNDFETLLGKIGNSEKLVLQKQDNVLTSELKYFRLDVKPSHENGWKLEIQDNTPKRVKMGHIKKDNFSKRNQRFYGCKKSLSSIFANITVSKDIDPVDCKQVAELLRNSQENSKTVKYPEQPQIDKKRKKKKKKGQHKQKEKPKFGKNRRKNKKK